MTRKRPDPDLLLAAVQATPQLRTEGALKVYLGMSAGVGKTYTMLNDAIVEAKRGTDVVAGFIQPHGRQETEQLAEQLELLPTKSVEYRGLALSEFDLDAALKRKPEIVLIDELAHTNVEGSRHEKRWQDVQELLNAGIDVWTTVNVQHLESLRDTVAKITGVEVQETVPDSLLARADEVELVDTPPDELLVRLQEGKIYNKSRVPQALSGFFRKGNLIALRELVLRHTAERVDAQLRRYKVQHGVEETWHTSEKILVCVAPNALSSRVVRAAGRLAASLHAELFALSIESLRYVQLSPEQRAHATEALRVAESLGATTVVINGEDIVEAILSVSRERGITSIVVGKPLQARWREAIFGSVVDDLIRSSGDINIHVIPGRRNNNTPVKHLPRIQNASFPGVLGAVVATAVSTAVAWLMFPYFDVSNIIMIYLLGVTWAASRLSKGDAALSAILSVLAFDFFFVAPFWTFAVSDVQYLVTFITMLIVGLLISSLTLRLRAQTQVISERERRTSHLYELARRLGAVDDVSVAVSKATEKLEEILRLEVVILLPTEGQLTVERLRDKGFGEAESETAVAQWVLDHSEPAGADTTTLSAAVGRYIPLVSSQHVVGVLGLKLDKRKLERQELDLLSALADQVALAIERIQLKETTLSSEIMTENERLKNALLSSVSHDLRTPLASISGAASALTLNPGMPETTRSELAKSISDESHRLERILRNVLDVTRLDSGQIELVPEWNSVEELIGSALARVRPLLIDHKVEVDIEKDLPLVRFDAILMEQMFVNLLENAARYTPPGVLVSIGVRTNRTQLEISISDSGPGITPGDEEHIFERLYRSKASPGQGFGLGLAICRAIAAAHGGSIVAENNPRGGARFVINLPLGDSSPEVPNE